VLAVGLAGFAGASSGAAAALGVSVLVGQLSIGWCNDAVDAVDDAAAGRLTKPVVRGLVEASTVWRAAVIALITAAVLSVALLGWVAGGLHVVAVLAAWAYNLRLKETAWSVVPYAVAFGLVPLIVATVAAPTDSPGSTAGWFSSGTLWALAGVGGMLGAGAHLANTAPDVDSDRAVGRGGLAVRIGSPAARVLAVAFCAVAAGLLLVTLAEPTGPLAGALVGQIAVLGLLAAWREGRWLFTTMLVVAGVDAVLLLVLG
jgi:4-hydroxybenzoate polyprenyltransferase